MPAVQQRPDILFGLTHLNTGEETIEAETAQQVAGDQGNPCLFLRFEFDAGEVTGISAVEGKALTEHIVNNGNDQIPKRGNSGDLSMRLTLAR